jgi:cell pole-organizing protein PopZ
MRQEGEPSVEEILESIKKVIARDNRESLQAERRRRETASPAPGPAPAPAMASPPRPQAVHAEAPQDQVLDLEESAQLVDDEGLTTEGAARSMRESLEALALIAEPGAQPQIVRSGETSLEGLVRDLLRPQLADWLDRNLPQMVERLVKAEIARIAGKKG